MPPSSEFQGAAAVAATSHPAVSGLAQVLSSNWRCEELELAGEVPSLHVRLSLHRVYAVLALQSVYGFLVAECAPWQQHTAAQTQ